MNAAPDAYVQRLVDRRLDTLFAEVPALLLIGPRATGKTTTARRLATDIVRLDRPAEATAFLADPDAALRQLREPALLDEWQEVPGVLGAVKRAVDDDPRAGRFLLTGSVRADLQATTWPGTGRVVRVPLYGLTEREIQRNASAGSVPFLDKVAANDPDGFSLPPERPDLVGYIQLALRSGFPEPALRLSESTRGPWLASYLDQLLTRDAASLGESRDPARLRRFFEVLALSTAGMPNLTSLTAAAGINTKTARAYEDLLTNLLVLESVPAWTTNRLSRLIKTPKRYVVDPALAATAGRVDTRTALRDGDLLGRLIDTFVVAQLRPEITLMDPSPRLHHLRTDGGRQEVDLVAEMAGGAVVGIEVKATAAPTSQDARHLAWLRDELGERFLGGGVLHTGPRIYHLGERIWAVPICALWG